MNDRTAPTTRSAATGNPLLDGTDLPLFDAITPALVGGATDQLISHFIADLIRTLAGIEA